MKAPVISKVSEGATYYRIAIYGQPGLGKTTLAAGFPSPLIFDLEGGTLSLKENYPDAMIVQKEELTGKDDRGNPVLDGEKFLENIDWLATPAADHIKTVVIDSLTEMQASYLDLAKTQFKNGMQAYGAWNDYMRLVVRKLFALKKHIIFIMRAKSGEGLEGDEMIMPELSPGAFSTFSGLIGYGFFMKTKKGVDGKASRVLITQPGRYWAKVRGTMPDLIEDVTPAKLMKALANSNKVKGE